MHKVRRHIEPQSGYDRSSHRVAMTDRAIEWLDAVPARDAVPGEDKGDHEVPDEV